MHRARGRRPDQKIWNCIYAVGTRELSESFICKHVAHGIERSTDAQMLSCLSLVRAKLTQNDSPSSLGLTQRAGVYHAGGTKRLRAQRA